VLDGQLPAARLRHGKARPTRGAAPPGRGTCPARPKPPDARLGAARRPQRPLRGNHVVLLRPGRRHLCAGIAISERVGRHPMDGESHAVASRRRRRGVGPCVTRWARTRSPALRHPRLECLPLRPGSTGDARHRRRPGDSGPEPHPRGRGGDPGIRRTAPWAPAPASPRTKAPRTSSTRARRRSRCRRAPPSSTRHARPDAGLRLGRSDEPAPRNGQSPTESVCTASPPTSAHRRDAGRPRTPGDRARSGPGGVRQASRPPQQSLWPPTFG
jgi:hypothetical protein